MPPEQPDEFSFQYEINCLLAIETDLQLRLGNFVETTPFP